MENSWTISIHLIILEYLENIYVSPNNTSTWFYVIDVPTTQEYFFCKLEGGFQIYILGILCYPTSAVPFSDSYLILRT